jgi:hypothetical protein
VVVHPQLELTLPIARSVSLFTGENWEGRGVQPDVAVPAEGALDAALDAALTLLRHGHSSPHGRMGRSVLPR